MGKDKQKLGVLLVNCGFSLELLKVTLSQCTTDEVVAAQEKLKSLELEKKETEEKPPSLFWLEDIKKFTSRYCKYYKCDYQSPSDVKEKEDEEGEGEEENGEEKSDAEDEGKGDEMKEGGDDSDEGESVELQGIEGAEVEGEDENSKEE
jgi:hypothetical protein